MLSKRPLPLKLGTETPWGEIGAVLFLNKGRYYLTRDKHGVVSLMPAFVVEPANA